MRNLFPRVHRVFRSFRVFRARPHLLVSAVAGLSLLFAAACGGGGSGTVQPPPPPPPAGVTLYPTTGSGPEDVVLGDFDGDGDLDVATANTGAVGSTNVVTLFENPGSGLLKPGVSVAVTPASLAWSSIALAVGDLDGNAFADLVVLFVDGDSYAVVPGASTLAGMTALTAVAPSAMAGSFPQALALGNFDADAGGKPDLAVALSATDQVLIFPGTGTGSFGATPVTIATPIGSSPWGVAGGDLNRDGMLDVAAVGLSGTPVTGDPLVYGFLGSAFTVPVLGENRPGSQLDADLAVGDLNGDGFADAVRSFYDTGSVGVFWATTVAGGGLSPGDLAWHTTYGAVNVPRDVVLADDDGDSDRDIFVTGGGASGVVGVLHNGPALNAGTFTWATTLATYATPVALAVGDLDGNGVLDIVTVHPASSQIAVRLR
ncbi:MAG: VCBS repeat-containing protein [Nitrospirota bacterium]|nr:VCBS repeat-containing protein [Nitrospirota bacterium]